MRKIVTFVREHWDSIILCCFGAALIAVAVFAVVMDRSNSQREQEAVTPPSCTCVIINIDMTEACTVEKNDGSTATYIDKYGITCALATNETHRQKRNGIYHPIAPPRYGVHSVV